MHHERYGRIVEMGKTCCRAKVSLCGQNGGNAIVAFKLQNIRDNSRNNNNNDDDVLCRRYLQQGNEENRKSTVSRTSDVSHLITKFKRGPTL